MHDLNQFFYIYSPAKNVLKFVFKQGVYQVDLNFEVEYSQLNQSYLPHRAPDKKLLKSKFFLSSDKILLKF